MSDGVQRYSTVDQFFRRAARKGATKDVNASIITSESPFSYKSNETLDTKEKIQGLVGADQFDEANLLGEETQPIKEMAVA